jgi:hypothetical protein
VYGVIYLKRRKRHRVVRQVEGSLDEGQLEQGQLTQREHVRRQPVDVGNLQVPFVRERERGGETFTTRY